jgi:hypothetical protein
VSQLAPSSTASNGRHTWSRQLIDLVLRYPLPSFHFNLRGTPTGATELRPSADGCRILLAADQGWVARVADRPIFDERYRELRHGISEHVRSPSFDISHDGKVLTEQFAAGIPLGRFDSAEQLRLAKQIIAQYVTLCAHASRPAAPSLTLRYPLDAAPWPIRSELTDDLWETLVTAAPWTPSHGDAVAKNYLIHETMTTLIDWEPALVSLRPFWFDAITIFRKNERLARSFARGGLDADFARLWEASRAESFDIQRSRRALLAAWCVVVDARSPRPGPSPRGTGSIVTRSDDASALTSWQFWEAVLADES